MDRRFASGDTMATATLPSTASVEQLLGDQAASLLEHHCETVDAVDAAPARA